MRSFLVTGGAGFIGSHLVEELLRRGHRVRVADNLSTGKHDNIDAARRHAASTDNNLDVVIGDLADVEVAKRAVEGMDVVLHQAAIPSVPRSIDDPLPSHRSNIDATVSVLVAARDAGVSRVVFAGSSSEYGDTPALPKHEGMPVNPLSPYALQKVVGEQYLQQFTAHYGLDTVSIRYFNVFGPRQDPSSPYSGVISLFIQALFQSKAPLIHGDGEQTRDFTYVANVVDGVLRAAEVPGIAGQVMNVATGTRVSLNGLLATLQRIIGTSLRATYGPARKGDVRDSQADISKAETLLGYRPSVSLEEGLRRTVEWYRGD